ncbi:MAG: tetratricopeptide repeat protein [bacterium]
MESENQEQQVVAEEGEKESKAGKFFGWAIKMGLYALAFLMPLFFLPFTSNVLELNKQFLLFVASFVLTVMWLAKVLTQRKLEIKKSLLNILVVVFLAAVLISAVFSKGAFAGLVGAGTGLAESFLTIVCLALVYFLAVNTFKAKKEVNVLVMIMLCSATLAGVFGLLQLTNTFMFSWDFAKASGFNTVGSANAFEIFLAAVLVLAVAQFTDAKKSLWQLIALGIGAGFLLFLIIALNFSNVWWALIGVMIMVVGFGIIKQGRASQTRLILAMVVLAMALLLSLTKINISGSWLNVPSEVSLSYKATLEIDKGALGDKLFFGTGPASFAYNWELYRSSLVNQTVFWNVRFNQGVSKVFAMPAGLGIIGTGFWMLLVVFFGIWGALRLMTRTGENWSGALAFYSSWLFLAAMQFLYPTNLTLEFMFWFTLGISLFLLKGLKGAGQTAEEPEAVISLSFRKESPLASVFSFLLVIFLVLTISFFYLGFNYWRADAVYQRGVTASVVNGNLEQAYNDILKAASLNTYRDTYLASLAQVALARVNEELAKPKSADRDLRAQQFIADSVNLSKAATELNSQNSDNWIQRGTIYRSVIGYLSGAEDWMLLSFIEATKLSPKNPYAFFELGSGYMVMADLTASQAGQDAEKQAKAIEYLGKAEEQFNKAIEVKSDYAPAHYQLALIYDRQGKIDSAIEKMEITKANFPNDIGVAFQLGLLYYKKQDWAKSQAEFERSLTLDANYSNARYFLGLIYDRQNEKQKAIDQFEKIMALNPDNQEVPKIIENLKAGKAALDGIAPPAQSPENRAEVPVTEKQPEVK